MMRKNIWIYLAAWLLYSAFSFLAFPYLRITVMLFSIPLTMLGGWLFLYKGAFATTALTIPLHYLMLRFNLDDPTAVAQAFNPFGIGAQICFSFSTALLKKSQQRYESLNARLGTIVEERTKELSLMAGHLLQIQEEDRAKLTSGMVDEPLGQLRRMLGIGTLLKQHLATTGNSELGNAETIVKLVTQCIDQLSSVASDALPTNKLNESTMHERLHELRDNLIAISSGAIAVRIEGAWDGLDQKLTDQLYSIIREAVANAIRHAKPSEIVIGKCSLAGSICVYVENDGMPFPAAVQEGMGLPLMRSRATLIRSHLTIGAGPTGRTRVQCLIPKTDMPEKSFSPEQPMAK